MRKAGPSFPLRIDLGVLVTDTPRPCDRCGGPVQQPPTGRRRLYCGRTCRELAYRARARERAIADALLAAGLAPVSSTDATPAVAAIPVTSVVETGRPLRPGPSQRRRRRLLPPPPGVVRD